MSSLSLPLVIAALTLAAAWLVGGLVFGPAAALAARWPRLSRFLLVIAALPLLTAVAVGAAAVMPGDPHHGPLLQAPAFACHCAAGSGWLHLCPAHPGDVLGWVPLALLALGAFLPGRLSAWRHLLFEPAGVGNGAVPTLMALPRPTAMLVGWWRPSLIVDRGLWNELSGDERAAVLAHERAHLFRRDPLVLMAIRVLVSFGPARSGQALTRAWLDGAERAADARAASEVGTEVLAGTLLRCARVASSSPHVGLSWTGGRLEQRVRALLSDAPPSVPAVSGPADLVLLTVVGLGLLSSTPWLHHQIEHLLNFSL